MKRSDYKNHLDKIKCSPEFQAKMEELLSAERDGEYADSVSDVERVTKINYHRWTSLAASAVLVLGLGGTALYLTKNSSPPLESMMSDVSDSENQPFFDVEFSAEACNMSVTMNDDLADIDMGTLPAEAANDIIKNLDLDNLENSDSDKFFESGYETRLSIFCTGAEEFVYTVNSNGYVMLERNGEQSFYYKENGYFRIVSIIAQYLPYCDWTSMVGGETGKKLDDIFKEHINEIERTRSEVDGFNSWVMLMWKEPYTVYIDQYGKITVFYDTPYDSGYGGNGEITVSFSSSPEMYEEIVRELGKELGIEAATEAETAPATDKLSANESVYKMIDENISSEPMDLRYRLGSGQFDSHFSLKNIDMNQIVKIVKSHNWEISKNNFPKGSFYIVRNLIMSTNGEIYNSQTGVTYKLADDNSTDLIAALENLKASDEFTSVMSLLAYSGKYSIISSGDFSLYYSDAAASVNSDSSVQYVYRGGTGNFYHDTSGNEYFMIKSPDGSYTAEYFEQNRDWTLIESGDKIAEFTDTENNSDNSLKKISSGFMGMDSCVIDYDYICSYALLLINDAYETPEITCSADSRYDEETGYSVFSLSADLYETDTINITLCFAGDNLVKALIERINYTTGEAAELCDFQLGDGMGGGITYSYDASGIYSEISEDMKLERTQTEE